MSRSSAPTRTLFGENAYQGLRKQRMSWGWRSLKGTISATKAHQGLQPGHERCFGKSPSRVAEATYELRLKVLEGHCFGYKSPSRPSTLTQTLLWKGPSRVQVTKAMYVSSLKALEVRQLIKAFQGLSTSKALEGHQLKEALQWLSTSTHMLLPKLESLKGFSPIPLTKFRSKSYVV